MSAVQAAAAPTVPLYRIGRAPNPLAWPVRAYVGSERFDDPRRRFRTLYAAEQRRVCFVETLAPYRPDLRQLAAEANVASRERPWELSKVPADWCDERRIGHFRLKAEQSWLDLRAFETREALRRLLARELLNLGLSDLDVSVALTTNRALTQAVARWAYENGYHGIAYTSRFDIAFNCWAVFDNGAIEPILPFEPISRDDPDLQAMAALFGLSP